MQIAYCIFQISSKFDRTMSYLLGILQMNLGATYLRRKEIDSARPHLQASQKYYEQAGSRDFLPELHRYLAEAALAGGDLAEAELLAQQALSLARELKMRGEEGNALRSLGEIAYAKTDLPQSEQRLGDSLKILEEVEHENESTCSQLSLAKVHLAQNKLERGMEELNRCIQTFEKLGAGLDLATAAALKDVVEKK